MVDRLVTRTARQVGGTITVKTEAGQYVSMPATEYRARVAEQKAEPRKTLIITPVVEGVREPEKAQIFVETDVGYQKPRVKVEEAMVKTLTQLPPEAKDIQFEIKPTELQVGYKEQVKIDEKEQLTIKEAEKVLGISPAPAYLGVKPEARITATGGVEIPALGVLERIGVEPTEEGYVRKYTLTPPDYGKDFIRESIEAKAETWQAQLGHALSLEKLGGLFTAGEIVIAGGQAILGDEKAFERLAGEWRVQRQARTEWFYREPEKALRKETTGIILTSAGILAGFKLVPMLPPAGKAIVGAGSFLYGTKTVIETYPEAIMGSPSSILRTGMGAATAVGGLAMIISQAPQTKFLEPGETIEPLRYEPSVTEVKAVTEQFKTQFKGTTVGKDVIDVFKGKTYAGEIGKFKTSELFVGIEKPGVPVFGDIYAFTTKVGERYRTFGFGDVYKMTSYWERPSARFYGGYGLSGVKEFELTRTPTTFFAESKLLGDPTIIKTWEVSDVTKVLTEARFKTTGVSVTPRGFYGISDVSRIQDISKAIVSGGEGGVTYAPSFKGFMIGGEGFAPPVGKFGGLGSIALSGWVAGITTRQKLEEELTYVSPHIQKQIQSQISGLQQGLGITQIQARLTGQKQLQQMTQGFAQALGTVQVTGVAQVQAQQQIQGLRQMQKQLQQQATAQASLTATITTLPTPTVSKMFVLPSFFPEERKRRKKRRRKKKRKVKYEYKPSLIGVTFKIPQVTIPKQFTGLGIRGIPDFTYKKKRRKKKMGKKRKRRGRRKKRRKKRR